MISSGASRAFFLLVLILSSAVVATGPLQDPDLWWHIKTGETIVSSGYHFPFKDIYSFTAAGRPWRAYSWLPEVIFFFVSRVSFFGNKLFALVLLRILLLVATSAIIFFSVEKLIKNPQFSAALVFASWCSVYPLWELRPHVFSMMCLVIVVAILVSEYIDEKFIVSPKVLPAIFLLWANSHIYFVWALVIFLAYLIFSFLQKRSFADKKFRRYLFLFALSVAATFINPYGAGVWSQFWELARHRWTWSWVMEMARPYPWDTRVAAFWGYVVLSAMALWRLRRGALRPFFIFLLVFSFSFSMTALRHIFMYPIVSSLTLAAIFKELKKRDGDGVKLPPTILSYKTAATFVFFLLAIFVFRLYNDFRKPVADSVPTLAVEFINNNGLPTPMANYFDFGGYLIYGLWPDYKVFIDGRTQVYTSEFLDEYTLFQSKGPYDSIEIKKALDKYNIRSIVWASDHPLAETLYKIFPKLLYKDKTAVIFAR